MRNYIIEGVGTFFLTLIYMLTGSPFAVGAMIAILTYTGAHISGAYFNPSVTVAMWIRGKIKSIQMLYYIIVQCVGSIFAALCFKLYMDSFYEIIPPVGVTLQKVLFAEMIMTFFFVFVFLSIVTTKAIDVGNVAGFIIGVAFSILVFFGGTFNPAISIGTSLVALLSSAEALRFMPLFAVGSLSGGILAAYAYKYFYKV
jgi:aquaporin Z